MTTTIEHPKLPPIDPRSAVDRIGQMLGGIGRRELGMLAALIVICLGIWASNPNFGEQSNVGNVVRQISMLGIFSIGSAFVIITGGIDLSVGSLVGLTGVIIAKISSPAAGGGNHPLWVGILVAVTVVTAIGLIQGLLITQLDLQPFIVTLGVMLLIRGVSQTIVHGGSLGFGTSPFQGFANDGIFVVHHVSLISYPTLVFLIAILLGGYVLHFTVFGRYIYAIGGNRDAAAYSGVPIKKVETLTYVISAFLAAVAGVCYASYIGEMNQYVGIAYELYAIAACVLGGCSLRGGEGTVIGVVIGSSLMRVIENGNDMFQLRIGRFFWAPDTNWKLIVIGGVILIAVILDQIVHLVQAARRTRAAGAVSTNPEPNEETLGTASPP